MGPLLDLIKYLITVPSSSARVRECGGESSGLPCSSAASAAANGGRGPGRDSLVLVRVKHLVLLRVETPSRGKRLWTRLAASGPSRNSVPRPLRTASRGRAARAQRVEAGKQALPRAQRVRSRPAARSAALSVSVCVYKREREREKQASGPKRCFVCVCLCVQEREREREAGQRPEALLCLCLSVCTREREVRSRPAARSAARPSGPAGEPSGGGRTGNKPFFSFSEKNELVFCGVMWIVGFMWIVGAAAAVTAQAIAWLVLPPAEPATGGTAGTP